MRDACLSSYSTERSTSEPLTEPLLESKSKSESKLGSGSKSEPQPETTTSVYVVLKVAEFATSFKTTHKEWKMKKESLVWFSLVQLVS